MPIASLMHLILACSITKPSCPEGMVLITAGDTQVGLSEPTRAWHRAAHTVDLGTYCIDAYEHPNQNGAIPTANVSWNEAQALCVESGKRLCSENEWERACRGPTGTRYSYGAERNANTCNTPIDGSGPGKGRPAPVSQSGQFENCQTAEGVFDMNGNLSEWVADPWTGEAEPFRPEATPDPDTWRTLRGGTMWSQTFYGQDCLSRHGHPIEAASGTQANARKPAAFKNMDDGFRCCADTP